MKPVRTDKTNRVYSAEGCEDLPATVIEFTDNTTGVETCFELSPEEIEEVVKTGRIYITFEGHQIIPFLVNVSSFLESPVSHDNKLQ